MIRQLWFFLRVLNRTLSTICLIVLLTMVLHTSMQYSAEDPNHPLSHEMQTYVIYMFVLQIGIDILFYFLHLFKLPINMIRSCKVCSYSKMVEGWTIIAYKEVIPLENFDVIKLEKLHHKRMSKHYLEEIEDSHKLNTSAFKDEDSNSSVASVSVHQKKRSLKRINTILRQTSIKNLPKNKQD